MLLKNNINLVTNTNMLCAAIVKQNRQCVNTGKCQVHNTLYCGIHAKQLVEDTCCICLEDMNRYTPTKILGCSHIIHKSCYHTLISQYLLNCPLCRKRISNTKLNEFIGIYINDCYYRKDIREVFDEAVIKHISKRQRRYRPDYVLYRFTRYVRDNFHHSEHEIDDEIDLCLSFEITTYISYSIQYKYFSNNLKHLINNTENIPETIFNILSCICISDIVDPTF